MAKQDLINYLSAVVGLSKKIAFSLIKKKKTAPSFSSFVLGGNCLELRKVKRQISQVLSSLMLSWSQATSRGDH